MTTYYPTMANCNFATRTDDRGRLVFMAMQWGESGKLDHHDRGEAAVIDALDRLEALLEDGAGERDDADSVSACRAAEEAVAARLVETRAWFLDAFAGERIDAPAAVTAMDRIDWTDYYPVIDTDLRYTGDWVYADDESGRFASYRNDAMIDRGDAAAAGWTVSEDGEAEPPRVVARHEERASEGTGWYVYVEGRDAGGPFETEDDALESWLD